MIDQVLAWVNEQRQALDKPPIAELSKGRRRSACNCPVARSLSTDSHAARTTSSDTIVHSTAVGDLLYLKHPGVVVEFIREFDRGEYPDLIEQSA